MVDKSIYFTAKVDFIVVIEGSPGRREGQLKVGVDHSDGTGQQNK
jgi:hypothetical protein